MDWGDLPARQRSMRAVFDHSWDLLTQRERDIFPALSVFQGRLYSAGRTAGGAGLGARSGGSGGQVTAAPQRCRALRVTRSAAPIRGPKAGGSAGWRHGGPR